MQNSKILSTNIKKYRFLLGITQDELAQKLFVTPQAVSKWETGLALPDVENLIKLADVFSVSADTLLGRDTQSMTGPALIGVDGGGTKTEFVLFLPDGKILSRIVLGGSNPNVVGVEETCRVIAQGLDSVISHTPSAEFVFMGIAGTKSGSNLKAMTLFMKKKYPFLRFSIDSDILNIIWSSGDPSDCIAAICGTGSVVYASVGENLYRAGGWGYLFDGAGSGFDIGRDALCSCLAKDDGIGTASRLTELVEQNIGGKVFDHIDLFYSKGKDYIASFAPMVFSAYEEGDKVAEKIIRRSADRVALLISGMHDRFSHISRVVLSGGLISNNKIMKEFIVEKLKKELTLVFPSLPPVFGACAKCLNMYNRDADIKVFEREFSKSYEEKV
ncbi:MAG: BadF/BadG/BcrA/BcrD ATPase family protein [Monoglobales bacterium]